MLLLKQYLNYNLSEETREKIKNIILALKKTMLTQKIEIDDKYKELSYMNGYDFSNENIIKRIKKI